MGSPVALSTAGFPGGVQTASEVTGSRVTKNGGASQGAVLANPASAPQPNRSNTGDGAAGSPNVPRGQTDTSPDPLGYHLPDATILAFQLRSAQGQANDLPLPGNGTQPASSTASQQPLNFASQESDMESALESMGMSPGAIEEFMYLGQMLAQAAPELFQDFVAQTVNLASLYQQAHSRSVGNGLKIGSSVPAAEASLSKPQASTEESLSAGVQRKSLTAASARTGHVAGEAESARESTSPASSSPIHQTTAS